MYLRYLFLFMQRIRTARLKAMRIPKRNIETVARKPLRISNQYPSEMVLRYIRSNDWSITCPLLAFIFLPGRMRLWAIAIVVSLCSSGNCSD